MTIFSGIWVPLLLAPCVLPGLLLGFPQVCFLLASYLLLACFLPASYFFLAFFLHASCLHPDDLLLASCLLLACFFFAVLLLSCLLLAALVVGLPGRFCEGCCHRHLPLLSRLVPSCLQRRISINAGRRLANQSCDRFKAIEKKRSTGEFVF